MSRGYQKYSPEFREEVTKLVIDCRHITADRRRGTRIRHRGRYSFQAVCRAVQAASASVG